MTEREQFEDWKATLGPQTTSIQDIDDCMWLMAWAAWQARAALEQQAEPAIRLTVTVDDSNPLDRHHFELVWLQTPYAAGEYLYYAAPPAQQAEPDKMTDPVERARYWKLRALAAEGQVKGAATLAKAKC
jgi:hypothetical protein